MKSTTSSSSRPPRRFAGSIVGTILVLVLALALSPFSISGASGADPAPEPAAPGADRTETSEIRSAVESAFATLAALEIQAKAAPDGQQALDIQARIGQTKRGLQKQVLEIQLDYARRDGRLDKAAEIEASLARMAKLPAGEPQSRPLPPSAPAAR